MGPPVTTVVVVKFINIFILFLFQHIQHTVIIYLLHVCEKCVNLLSHEQFEKEIYLFWFSITQSTFVDVIYTGIYTTLSFCVATKIKKINSEIGQKMGGHCHSWRIMLLTAVSRATQLAQCQFFYLSITLFFFYFQIHQIVWLKIFKGRSHKIY